MSPALRPARTALGILLFTALPGVAAVGAWSSLGPDGGAATSLAVDPADPAIVYAGSSAGIHKSTDAGETWTLASRGLLLQEARIDEHTVAPGVLYAITAVGVFKSTDDAQTWAQAASLPEPPQALAVDPVSPDRVWAASLRGRVYFSPNGGKSWTKRQKELPPALALAVSPQGDWLYAATVDGFFRSPDLGKSWRPTQGLAKAAEISDIEIDPGDPSTLYGAGSAGLYRSRDKGATWQRIAAQVLDGWVVEVEIQGSRIFAMARQGIFLSSDGGSTWTLGPDQPDGPDVFALAASPDVVFAGAGSSQTFALGGVFRSLDHGATWQPAQRGFVALSINAVAVAPSDPDVLYVVAGWSEVFRSLDRGATWERLDLGIPNGTFFYPSDVLVDPSDASTVYVANQGSAMLLRSEDGGETWDQLQVFDSPAHLAVDPRSPGSLWATGFYGVFYSRDRGTTWQRTSPKVSRRPDLRDIEVDAHDPKVIWAAGEAFLAHSRREPRIFRSTNGGQTWERRDTGVGGKVVLGLALDPAAPSTLYAATDRGLYRSTDSGRTWKLLPGVAGEVTQVVTAPTTPTAVYAFLSGFGVMRSTDRGKTWSAARRGLGALPLLELIVDPNDPRRLYAGTLTRGLFTYEDQP